MKIDSLRANYLYHATLTKTALDILTSNILKAKTEHAINDKKIKGVSTTRSFDYAIKWSEVTFEFDKDKLSHSNKIIPVDFSYSNPDFNIKRRENAEDFIVGDVKNVKSKISCIYLNFKAERTGYFDDLLDVIEENSIKYKML